MRALSGTALDKVPQGGRQARDALHTEIQNIPFCFCCDCAFSDNFIPLLLFSKASGNKVSRQSVLCGSQNIVLNGKVYIQIFVDTVKFYCAKVRYWCYCMLIVGITVLLKI